MIRVKTKSGINFDYCGNIYVEFQENYILIQGNIPWDENGLTSSGALTLDRWSYENVIAIEGI